VAKLVESSREAESSGRLGEALAEMEGAVAQAGSMKPPYSDLDDLRRSRDALARREAEHQLNAFGGPAPAEDPGRTVGRALTLLARVRKNEALDGLEPRVLAALDKLRLRWVEADAKAAEAAAAAGKPAESMELCRRQYKTADELPKPDRAEWQARATVLARRIIARHGALIEPVRGKFTQGSSESYAALFKPAVNPAFLSAGYLPRPADTVFEDLWTSLAPYRLTIEVNEHQDETYLESLNRITSMDATLTLTRQGERLWKVTPLAKTTVPLPGLPAYQAGRVSVGGHRNVEFERLLYENARANLLNQIRSQLGRLPPCTAANPQI
jgi:hypothetical protein